MWQWWMWMVALAVAANSLLTLSWTAWSKRLRLEVGGFWRSVCIAEIQCIEDVTV